MLFSHLFLPSCNLRSCHEKVRFQLVVLVLLDLIECLFGFYISRLFLRSLYRYTSNSSLLYQIPYSLLSQKVHSKTIVKLAHLTPHFTSFHSPWLSLLLTAHSPLPTFHFSLSAPHSPVPTPEAPVSTPTALLIRHSPFPNPPRPATFPQYISIRIHIHTTQFPPFSLEQQRVVSMF